MDYKKHYDALMSSRSRTILREGEYYERHHKQPKCVGGDNSDENLVFLTAREHYIAHWLLTKMYPKEWKLYYAFFQMSKMNKRNIRVISSKQCERAKKYFSIGAKLRSKIFSPGQSENSKKRARERMKSNENPMKKYPEKNPFLGKSYVKGRKWYNNGLENLYLGESDVVPDGFVPGMKPYNRKRNGTKSNHM